MHIPPELSCAHIQWIRNFVVHFQQHKPSVPDQVAELCTSMANTSEALHSSWLLLSVADPSRVWLLWLLSFQGLLYARLISEEASLYHWQPWHMHALRFFFVRIPNICLGKRDQIDLKSEREGIVWFSTWSSPLRDSALLLHTALLIQISTSYSLLTDNPPVEMQVRRVWTGQSIV